MCVADHDGIVAGIGGSDEAFRCRQPLIGSAGERQCHNQVCLGEILTVSPLCDPVAAQLKPPLGHASPDVWAAHPAFEVIRNRLETVAVDGL
jgi:hypothetical protein